MTEKRCPECGETKPLSQFYANRRSLDGRQRICARCAYLRYKVTKPYLQLPDGEVMPPVLSSDVEARLNAYLAESRRGSMANRRRRHLLRVLKSR